MCLRTWKNSGITKQLNLYATCFNQQTFFVAVGYMIANWLIRSEGMNTAKAVSTFAAFRLPGIYKDSYIHQLFKYNHELR